MKDFMLVFYKEQGEDGDTESKSKAFMGNLIFQGYTHHTENCRCMLRIYGLNLKIWGSVGPFVRKNGRKISWC